MGLGIIPVPLGWGWLPTAGGLLESIARWPGCGRLAPSCIPALPRIGGIALCKPVHGPVQTSASSMTPVLHPTVTMKSFQELSHTYPMPVPFAAHPQAAA